jgi:hypothetical protein
MLFMKRMDSKDFSRRWELFRTAYQPQASGTPVV